MTNPKYQMIEAQRQFWAEVGQYDSVWNGTMAEPAEQSAPFSTREAAAQWLADQGWEYSETALRLVNPKKPYSAARIRQVNEFRPEKWL